MEEWIRQLLGLAANPVRDIVTAVEARLSSLWSTVTGFFGRVRTGYITLRAEAYGWISAQLSHAAAIAYTLRWVMLVYVPRLIGQGLDQLRTYAVDLIRNAIATARAELITVRDWLSGLVNAVADQLGKWISWIQQRLGEIKADVTRLLDHVFGVLASPDRLIAWIIEPLVEALVKWTKDNAVRLGRRLVVERTQIFLSTLHLFEDIVSRIL